MSKNFVPKPIILEDLNLKWTSVLCKGTAKNHSKKSTIQTFADNKNKKGILYIKSGLVCLSHVLKNGEERILMFIGKGSIFNEAPFLSEGRDALFVCLEPTETIFLDEEQVYSSIKEYPELAFNLMQSLSVKVGCFYNQLCNVHMFSSFKNVCMLLLAMATYQDKNGTIIPRITQTEASAYLGIHRSSMHNALSKLKAEGIIGDFSKKKLSVINIEKLREYALFE